MQINQKSILYLSAAIAGVVLTAAPASAWLFRHRGYIYGPRVAVGGSRVGVSGELFPEFFSLRELAPLRESVLLRDSGSDVREVVRQEVSKHRAEIAAELAEARKSSSSPGPASVTNSGGSATCTQLIGRMDKIEERLATLSQKIESIEAKVNQILGEKQQKQHVEMIKSVVEEVTQKQNEAWIKVFAKLQEDRQKQKNVLYQILAELAKKDADRDSKKLKDLLDTLKAP